MANPRQLSNPPLREAVVDIRVSQHEGFVPESLSEVAPLLESEYAKRESMWIFEGRLELRPEGQPESTSRRHFHGLRYTDADETQVVQFKADGFTFSRLAPYTDWDDVFPEAMRLWATYVEVARPEYARRVALRYINAIDVQMPGDLADIFTAPPQLPPDAPAQDLVGFLVRTTSYDETTKAFVHSTQALERVAADGSRTIVLDIDAYREVDYRVPGELDMMERSFRRLRDVKNATFFAAITDMTVERYV